MKARFKAEERIYKGDIVKLNNLDGIIRYDGIGISNNVIGVAINGASKGEEVEVEIYGGVNMGFISGSIPPKPPKKDVYFPQITTLDEEI